MPLQRAGADAPTLKLGDEGALIQSEEQIDKDWIVDRIDAQNSNPVDVAGAGDSMLICTALALSVKANIWEASLLGSIAASVQISRLGNLPISKKEILKQIDLL